MESTPASRKKLQHPLPWLNMMVTEPYYLLHSLAFFSYFIARASATQSLSPEYSLRLLRREIQAVLIYSVYVVVKIVKEESWEGFIADALFFAKGFMLAVASVIDYQLAFCYFLAFVVLYVVAHQPAYDDLGDSSQLTPLQLETILTEGNTSRFWLVEFRSVCSSTCVRTSRFMSELSTIYSNKTISFGVVDLGHFPNAAEKFGISVGVTSGQLPTYILFDRMVEVARLPQPGLENNGPITKNLIRRHFELDQRLIDYVSGN